jgi:dephospho-CoA kinase
MQDRKVIVFVGMPGAGKSVCVEYLKSKGMTSVYFGGIVLDEVRAQGLEINESSEKMVRESIRDKEGKGAFAVRIIKQIEEYFEQGQKYVVVDGVYSWTEYKIFKQIFGPNAIIIAIVSPVNVRHKRLAVRSERPLADEEATERDYSEIESLEKGGPIANADYFLANHGSVEAMEADLDKLLTELGIHYS